MTIYSCRARDQKGEIMTTVVDAADEMAAALSLRTLGYTVISVERETKSFTTIPFFEKYFNKVTKMEIIFLCRQLSALLRSGITLNAALSSIAQQTQKPILKTTLGTINKDIIGGQPFSKALSRHPKIFSEMFVSMIHVGESAGALDQVIERMGQLYTQEAEIDNRVKAAMTYPVILSIVAVLIVGFLMVNIVPKFLVVFQSYNAKLPMPTQILLMASFVIRKLWPYLILLIIGFIVWFQRNLQTEHGRYAFHKFLLSIPIFKTTYIKIIVSHFTRALGVMLKSGVPVLDSLRMSQKIVDNMVVKKMIDNVIIAVTSGKSLSEPLRAAGIFPPTVLQMVKLGEESGRLDQMLVFVADFYDQEVDYTLKNLTTILEPVMLLFMGGIVGFIALSILLPIFNLVHVFKK